MMEVQSADGHCGEGRVGTDLTEAALYDMNDGKLTVELRATVVVLHGVVLSTEPRRPSNGKAPRLVQE